ncbi:MAG: phosphatidylserine decarboxylase, partial [Candidatus Binatia bacterium]
NVKAEPFLDGGGTRIGIFMSPLNVHVNRIPVAGVVESVHYQAGKFRPAFAEDAADVNERNTVTLKDAQARKIVLVQIAGILARRIVCSLTGGERMQQGDRYGMIMLGSRVDLYCPAEMQVKVHIGQSVKAGESIIGEYPLAD